MISEVKIGNKSISIPLIQGGMGVGISLSGLAGNVMKEGGMGCISAAHPGYRHPNFWKDSTQVNIQALHEEVKKAKEIANGKGLCAINVMVASKNYDDYVKASVDAGADAIICGAGIPMKLPELVGDAPIFIAPIVSSAKLAKLILRAWDSHYNRIPDFIVIEGSLAGGHLGFRAEDIEDGSAQDLETILVETLPIIAPYEEKYKQKIPVFVAGGIYEGSDIAHFLKLGASGVQMGTRFIATHECDADIKFKEMFMKAEKADINLVKSPAGLPGRAINTSFMEQSKLGRIAPTRCIACMKPCIPATTPYCISDALIAAVKGDVQDGLVFSGSNGYRIKEIVSVHDLIASLMKDMEESL